ncbi:MAG: rhamnogalacturonan lyase [Dysgonamonadaceae bacterium]|jgi:rhamnogalacturonan endolyase|nr:rhamnogalacturonan lyase [Dysgonamonadaceae bacterium]
MGNTYGQRIMEQLNRGLVAVRTSENSVFLSWRVLGTDPDDMAFNLYRKNVKINSDPVTGASNYTDKNASEATCYTVKTVLNGKETGEKYSTNTWAHPYIEIPLEAPVPTTLPDSSRYYYTPNDCSTGDMDGDGEYEIVLKWDPSNSKDNSHSGYTGNVFLDVYKLNGMRLCRIDLGRNIRAGAHYTQFMVADFDGDGRAEIACKTAPGTKDGTGNYIHKGDASKACHTADYRNKRGFILDGEEYLTVFSGLTGEELDTKFYRPSRGDDMRQLWGDNNGNRVDRFLGGIAYLDGKLPSIIMCRGYYARATICAWDFRNGKLTERWFYDSGTERGVGLYGQGNHNMATGDVDDDGKDEIIWGSGALDDDGTLLYRTGLGHGDAMHLSDLDPDRPGLEVWAVHENKSAEYGEELHDARTGEIIWGNKTESDNGRGLAANIVAGNRSFEMWSADRSAIKDKTGKIVSNTRASMNFRIYWDGDLQDELLNGNRITKFGGENLLVAEGCTSNNGTKSTPALSADLFGDWREELVLCTGKDFRSLNFRERPPIDELIKQKRSLRIYTTTIPSPHKLYTLMHDAVYRNAVASQNTAYNQPPHAAFYIGDDMDAPPVSAACNKKNE